ncbi:hypothetical protein PV327_008018 [Microctonus hyperodae]|uniref:Cytochrome b5 heme-binding domain-containing protein n=1 Tax=Microctonus hyperodae TaxID=165561 RepID=A0AA39G0F3_MICHY|nr:hypothetical protein PV327_008018 [Microctonus hyperodae]
MLSGLKMWVPVILAIAWGLYLNEWSKQIIDKLMTGDISGAYQLYESGQSKKDSIDIRKQKDNVRLFTNAELEKYRNVDNGLYLAIVGQVFDVTKGEQHYGEGASYHAFTGRDASMAFITGDFTADGLTDDLSGLTVFQAKSVDDWLKIYHEKYEYKGKLIGKYYDQNGKPTDALEKFQQKVSEANANKQDEEEQKQMYPPCNIEWKPDQGTRVWCTKNSGGIMRDWSGVPRKYFQHLDSDKHRCACVNVQSPTYYENMRKFRKYEDCTIDATSCIIIKA